MTSRWSSVSRPVLDVVGTIAVAWLLLSALFASFAEGFRVLFNFMDVGLALWVVLLIVVAVRSSTGSVSARLAWLLLAIGAVVNLLVVITVGVLQTGGWAGELILFAVEAGAACLLAGALVIAVVHRLTAGRAAP